MPIQEYKSVDDFTMYTVFQTTPPISTNDIAIIMSEMDQVLNSTETVVNTWCRPHLKSHMTFAQYVAGNVTKYLGNNFKILKEVPKVDYVAIPSLNKRIEKTWGLIFYNEPDLICNEELHPASYKTTVMRSIIRDIIYQWFGNLFTPFCLSSHRLLNEGFITFLETHVIEKVYPDSNNITNLLVVETQHEALHLNSYSAMNSFANTSSISEIYSNFPFYRVIGPAILRMLNGTLPRNSLLMGLNAYFNTR
ncbi:Glutamyl aminopeptidase [Formica fusca]